MNERCVGKWSKRRAQDNDNNKDDNNDNNEEDNVFKGPMVLSCVALTWLLLPAPVLAQAQAPYVDLETERLQHEWVASGFVGSTFGDELDEAGLNFGSSLSYLYNGLIGGEFMASFAPDTQLETTAAFAPNGSSWVNTYMVNAIVAAPVGEDRLFQPFVSGGLGAINLRLDENDFGDIDPFQDNLTDTQLGANIGAGLMAFQDNWGVRGDVRWFRGLSDADEADGILDPDDLLADASFWRANIGVSYRW